VLTIGAEGVALAFIAERLSDWWTMGIVPFVACAVVVGVLPRFVARSGCVRCGYDWRGLPRCPECGTTNPARPRTNDEATHTEIAA
jgi:hypothetical protein